MFFSLNIFSQDIKEKYVGLSAGLYSGYGFSYRIIENDFGIQTNFGPYLSSENQVVSFGFTFLYKLTDFENTNLYLNFGNHLFFSSNSRNKKTKYLNGIGPCLQFKISENLFWEMMFGYGANIRLRDTSQYPTENYFTYTGGVSFLYRIGN